MGEKVKYNFVTGDLELIEGGFNKEKQESNLNETPNSFDLFEQQSGSANNLKSIIKKRAVDHHESDQLTSTAQGVKNNLESQLKTIFKSSDANQQQLKRPYSSNEITLTSRSLNFNQQEQQRPKFSRNATTKDLKNEINNHSYKDIDLYLHF